MADNEKEAGEEGGMEREVGMERERKEGGKEGGMYIDHVFLWCRVHLFNFLSIYKTTYFRHQPDKS